MFKIMQSGYDYDSKTATQQKNLYYAIHDNVPKIGIGNLAFYELNDLLALQNLSATKQKKLANIKFGKAVQLFHVGRERYYYAVLLNDKEENVLEKLQKEMDELNKINKDIELKVGDLLTIKKEHEKDIEVLKKNFNLI